MNINLFSSGIVDQTANSLVIHSAPGRLLVWVLAFILVMPAAWYCWRRGIAGHYAPGAFFASFIIPMLIIPGIATESVRVTPSEISIRTGFWFAHTKLEYPLVGVDGVVEKRIAVPQRRVPRRDRVWDLHYRSGSTRRLHLTDLLDANRAPVVGYLQHQGISFRAAEGQPG